MSLAFEDRTELFIGVRPNRTVKLPTALHILNQEEEDEDEELYEDEGAYEDEDKDDEEDEDDGGNEEGEK